MSAGATIDSDPEDGLQAPTMPPIQGAPPPLAAASPSQAPSPGAGAPAPLVPGQGQSAGQDGVFGGKKQIQTGPAKPPEYDPKKLSKVQTTLDLLNAMKPASRTDYMDWWEKQHGDINDRYDTMKTQLGARPSDDEPQSKKEKFAALLEFGLHLMKNSAPASTNQGAVLAGTLSDSVDSANQAHAANVKGQQDKYDASANAIESARADDLKGIGTPAGAMKEQADLTRQESENVKDRAGAFKDLTSATTEKDAARGPATYSTGEDGNLHSIERGDDGNVVAKPVLGIDGKPYRGRVLGRATGSGVEQKDTAQIRNYKYLTNVLGVDENTANDIAFRAKSGDPGKDHKDVYKSVLSSTMGDTDKAKTAADQYVIDNYGAGALTRATAPKVPRQPDQRPNTPPPEAMQGVTPGVVRDFGAKGRWTVDIQGNPVPAGVTGPAPLTPPH
jgi:hypothetical protein